MKNKPGDAVFQSAVCAGASQISLGGRGNFEICGFAPAKYCPVVETFRNGEKIMAEIDDVIRMLDNMAQGGVSRIKVEASEEVAEGDVKKAYHHGRCDVGSPFATGQLFDLEDET